VERLETLGSLVGMRKKDSFMRKGRVCGYETVVRAEMYKVELMARQVGCNL
jgi:hypothetical protein